MKENDASMGSSAAATSISTLCPGRSAASASLAGRASTRRNRWLSLSLSLSLVGCSVAPNDGADAATPDAATPDDDAATRDDAADAPAIDAGGCGSRTPLADVDAVIARYLASLAANPAMTGLGRYVYERAFVYPRARVAAGEVVMDPALVEACVASASSTSPAHRIGAAGGPCADMFRPRCPAPEGTACGSDADCDRELYCPYGYIACERSSHCTPRTPLGMNCDALDGCARPDDGHLESICASDGLDGARCTNVTFVSGATGWGPNAATVDADGLRSIVPECSPGAIYAANGACSTVTLGSLAEGATCNDIRECAPHLDCHGSVCVPFVSCASSECRIGEACVADACVPSDGALGAACDVAQYLCAPGLACHLDTQTCGPLLGLGELVGDPTAAGDCTSSCALLPPTTGPARCADLP